MFFLYCGHAVRQLPTTNKADVNVTWKLVGRRKASEEKRKEGRKEKGYFEGECYKKYYYIRTYTNLQTRE